MTSEMPSPPAGFDPEAAEFHNITPDRFTAVPKESHRRAGGTRELKSITSIGLLTLYLSNETGWKIPNATTLAAKYAEGPKQIRDAIAEVERAGFLVRYKLPNKRGHWMTHTVVSAHPETLDDVRDWAKRLAAAQAAKAAERKAAGITGGGRKAAEAAKAAGVGPADAQSDATFPQVGPSAPDRDSVHRTPVRRDSVDRSPVQRHLKNQETKGGNQEEKTLGEENSPPPPGFRGTAAPATLEDTTGGGEPDHNGNPKPGSGLLDILLAEVAVWKAGRRAWSPITVRRAVLAAADECGSLEMAVAAARVCYARAETAVPGRLPHDLDAWDAAARKVNTPAPSRICSKCEPYARGQIWLDGDPDRPAPCPGCRPEAAARLAPRRAVA